MSRRRNAYNSADDFYYCYQYEDIEKIGKILIRELQTTQKRDGNWEVAYGGIIMAPTLGFTGSGDNVVNRLYLESAITQLLNSLSEGKKVVGSYNIGDHQFIAYALLHNFQEERIDCYYKDSQSSGCHSFVRVMNDAFQQTAFSSFNLSKNLAHDQRDNASSGVFALQNMMILARSTHEDLNAAAEGKMAIPFYSPPYESYEKLISEQRKELGQKFALSLLYETTLAALRYEVVKRHKDESALLKSAILDSLCADLAVVVEDVDILNDEDSTGGYHYGIRVKPQASADASIHNLMLGISTHFLLDGAQPYYNAFGLMPLHVWPKDLDPTRPKLNALCSLMAQNENKSLALDAKAKLTVVENVIRELQPASAVSLSEIVLMFGRKSCLVNLPGAAQTDFSACTLEEIWRYVISEGRVELARVLLEAGSDPNMTIFEAGKNVLLAKSLCSELVLMKTDEDKEKEDRLRQILEELIDHGGDLSALEELWHEKRAVSAIQTTTADMADNLVDMKLSAVKAEIENRLTSKEAKVENFDHQLDLIVEKWWQLWQGETVKEAKIKTFAIAQSGENAPRECVAKYEAAYGAFCKFLQSQIRMTLRGVAAAASGIVKVKSDDNHLLHPLVKSIPYIGDLLAGHRDFFAGNQQLITLAEKIGHFLDNAHEDKVLQDYCLRVAEFCQLEILKHTQTDQQQTANGEAILPRFLANAAAEAGVKKLSLILAGNAVQSIKNGAAVVRERVISIADDILVRNRIEPGIKKNWQKLAAKYVLKFMAGLRDMPIHYNEIEGLGERIAEVVIPHWFREEPKLDASKRGFHLQNAIGLGDMAQLAYATSTKIKWMTGKTGRGSPWKGAYELCEVIERDHLQTVIIGTADALTISFRGTSNSRNWLGNFKITEARMHIEERTICLHSGFLNAVESHWRHGTTTDGKCLAEVVKTYLSQHPQGKVYLTGHSLGGGMASIAYLHMARLLGKTCAQQKIEVYTFAQPKWCKAESIKTAGEIFGDNYHRIVREGDLVVRVPQKKLGYLHVGTEYEVSGEELIQHQARQKCLNKQLGDRGIALAKALPKLLGLGGMEWLSEVLTDPILRAHSMEGYEAKLLHFRAAGKCAV